MTMLITGGAGFIGSNFIFYQMKHHPHSRIVCVDKLTYAGNLSTLESVMGDPRFRFVQGDICDGALMDRVFAEERPDIVVNFAAESHVDRSVSDPMPFIRTNIEGVSVLLNACRQYGVSRFHQISTDEVYGDLPLDSADRFTEAALLRPSSPYSASKAAADLLVLSYYRTYRLPVTVSRSVNNYGPYQYPEKLIPYMIASALEELPLPVYGDGRNIRSWLHVEDHCAAVDRILDCGAPGEIYNIGGRDELSNLDLVGRILRRLEKSEELISFVADRPGHDLKYAVSGEKLAAELGWVPQIDFESGLRQTIDWYLSHGDWWKPLWNRA